MGALVWSTVIWRVPSLKGGVRKKAPSQISINLWLVSVWTLIHLQGQLLGEGVRVTSACVCVSCAYMCPDRVGTWEGRSPARKEVIDSTWPRTDHFWLIFRRQGPGEYGHLVPLVS